MCIIRTHLIHLFWPTCPCKIIWLLCKESKAGVLLNKRMWHKWNKIVPRRPHRLPEKHFEPYDTGIYRAHHSPYSTVIHRVHIFSPKIFTFQASNPSLHGAMVPGRPQPPCPFVMAECLALPIVVWWDPQTVLPHQSSRGLAGSQFSSLQGKNTTSNQFIDMIFEYSTLYCVSSQGSQPI